MKKPEAERLATSLDWWVNNSDSGADVTMQEAACELRRLYAEKVMLLEGLESIRDLWEYEESCGALANRMYDARNIANRAISSVTK